MSDLSDDVFKMCSHATHYTTKKTNTILKWYPNDTEELFIINKRKNDPMLTPCG